MNSSDVPGGATVILISNNVRKGQWFTCHYDGHDTYTLMNGAATIVCNRKDFLLEEEYNATLNIRRNDKRHLKEVNVD